MKKDSIQIRAYFILGFLVVQYLLGMAANLFVTFPDTKNASTQWEFAKAQPLVILHIIVAVFLIIGGTVLLIQAIRRKNKQWIIVGIIGLVGLLGASITGARFIPTQQNVYSYIMAIAFILAFVSYGWGLYKAKQ